MRSWEVGKVVRIRIYRILGFAGLEEESCQNARRIWSSTPQIADCRGFHGCRGFGERAMNRTTTNGNKRSRSGDRSYKIRCRDREIAPTEDRKMSRSGDRSYRRGVGFYQIRGRDREIAPTEEGWVSIR